MLEEWGGDVPSAQVSAIKGQGVDELLELILLTADLLELKADPDLAAQAVVLEARKDPGRGSVATVLVQDGTLRIGDVFVSGSTWGKVRSMTDERGLRVTAGRPLDPGRGHRLRRAAQRRRQPAGGRQRAARALDRRVPPAGGAPPRAAAHARLALARPALRPHPGRRDPGSADRAQDRRAGLASRCCATRWSRSRPARSRSRSCTSGVGGITTNDVHAGRRVERDHRRLQRAARAHRRRSRRARKASTSAPTPSSTSSPTSSRRR